MNSFQSLASWVAPPVEPYGRSPQQRLLLGLNPVNRKTAVGNEDMPGDKSGLVRS